MTTELKHDGRSPAIACVIQQSCDTLHTIGESRDDIRGEHDELMHLIKDLLFEIVLLIEAGEKEYGEGNILRGKELYEVYDAYHSTLRHKWNRKESW